MFCFLLRTLALLIIFQTTGFAGLNRVSKITKLWSELESVQVFWELVGGKIGYGGSLEAKKLKKMRHNSTQTLPQNAKIPFPRSSVLQICRTNCPLTSYKEPPLAGRNWTLSLKSCIRARCVMQNSLGLRHEWPYFQTYATQKRFKLNYKISRDLIFFHYFFATFKQSCTYKEEKKCCPVSLSLEFSSAIYCPWQGIPSPRNSCFDVKVLS